MYAPCLKECLFQKGKNLPHVFMLPLSKFEIYHPNCEYMTQEKCHQAPFRIKKSFTKILVNTRLFCDGAII
jgi:hypothetical protein